MGFILAIFIFIYLIFFADAGKRARIRMSNFEYEKDRREHNYNTDLQFDMHYNRDGESEKYAVYNYPKLWELVINHKLSISIAEDVIIAKRLKDQGYDFNPHHCNHSPLLGTDGYKDPKLGTKILNEYREKVYKLMKECIEDIEEDFFCADCGCCRRQKFLMILDDNTVKYVCEQCGRINYVDIKELTEN